MKSVLFRVDGGGEIGVGMGHVYRCLRLAQGLSGHAIESSFCMKRNAASNALVQSFRYPVSILPSASEEGASLNDVLEQARAHSALLYIDLRESKKNLVSLARQRGIPTAVYDDVFEAGVVPDLLVNPSENCRNQYHDANVKYLLGRRYILIDPKTLLYKKACFARDVQRVFVCFGGADPYNLTTRVAKILFQKFPSVQVDIVLGPAFSNHGNLQCVIDEYRNHSKVSVHQNQNFLAPIIARADAAITSGGTVMCEAVAVHVPTLALPTIRHEVDIVETYEKDGLVTSPLCDANTMSDHPLAESIKRFITCETDRDKNFHAQLRCGAFDGYLEIIAHIEQLCGSRAGSYRL